MNSNEHIKSRLELKKESNVIEFDRVIIKSYDNRSMLRKTTRHPQIYANSKLQNFKYLVNWCNPVNLSDTLQIVQYDKVKGNHTPTRVGHLTNLLKELQELHQQGIVHGDIRLSNIIFSPKGDEIETTLIDFDLSGKHDGKIYPTRFNREIEDGVRHEEARSEMKLKYEHDVYAARWIIAKYAIDGIPFQTTDKELNCLIEELTALKQDDELNPASIELFSTKESGSPT